MSERRLLFPVAHLENQTLSQLCQILGFEANQGAHQHSALVFQIRKSFQEFEEKVALIPPDEIPSMEIATKCAVRFVEKYPAFWYSKPIVATEASPVLSRDKDM